MRKVDWLEPKTAIYPEDLEAWEKFANIKIGSGDAVFIRTGRYARRAKLGPWNAAAECAGLHASVIPWLKQRDIALLGSETVPDVQPSGVQGWPRPIHDILLPIMGTQLVDNGYYEDVAKEAIAPEALGVHAVVFRAAHSWRDGDAIHGARDLLTV